MELLVLQVISRQHRFYWMACQNWNIEVMIRLDWLSEMEKVLRRLLSQRDVYQI